MKKTLKSLCISIFCISTAVLLFACSSPAKYTITAKTSDPALGSISGFVDTALAEGTNIQLKAQENSAENPFMCWIKDDWQIVSNAANYSITYGEDTRGQYTAVFEETNINKMMYALVDSIKITNEDKGAISSIATYNVQLFYTMTGGENYKDLCSVTFTNEGISNLGYTYSFSPESLPTSVFYFGDTSSARDYRVKAVISATAGEITFVQKAIVFNTLVTRNNDDETGSQKITQDFGLLTADETGYINGEIEINVQSLKSSIFVTN